MSAQVSAEEIAIRILLVDRDVAAAMALADSLALALATDPDVIVVQAGREAMELLRSATFDLLLVDLESLASYGDTDAAVARLVRLAPSALVVALSDGSSVTATLAALSAGAHDHVARPIEGSALVGRLAELAHRHGRDIAAALAPPTVGSLAGLVDASGQLQDVLELVARGVPGGPEHLEGLVRRIVSMFGSGADGAESMRPTVLPMWRQEQRIIEEAIASFSGNITLAAQALELSPSTIYRKRQAWAELEGSKGAA
jgi:DNA-binding NtrC family response regulator